MQTESRQGGTKNCLHCAKNLLTLRSHWVSSYTVKNRKTWDLLDSINESSAEQTVFFTLPKKSYHSTLLYSQLRVTHTIFGLNDMKV